MTSHNAARRFAVASALFVIVLVARHLFPTKILSAGTAAPILSSYRIEGRWKVVRASLGLPQLPDIIYFPANSDHPSRYISIRASRFDLKRKRSLESEKQMHKTPRLYFATDALENSSVSLERIAASFRDIALVEKAATSELQRIRLMKQGKKFRDHSKP